MASDHDFDDEEEFGELGRTPEQTLEKAKDLRLGHRQEVDELESLLEQRAKLKHEEFSLSTQNQPIPADLSLRKSELNDQIDELQEEVEEQITEHEEDELAPTPDDDPPSDEEGNEDGPYGDR
jgi:hypothetical protein